jgi:hypothetical protein
MEIHNLPLEVFTFHLFKLEDFLMYRDTGGEE